MAECIVRAPAKLNRFLHIVGRRADGYHLLQTAFELIDWCDELSIEATDDGRIERVAGSPHIAPEQDLVVRAARRLQAIAPHRGCRISVNKAIPQGAGLGGGSSDAAAVLRALNRLWRLELDAPALAAIGLELGADVPVFVYGLPAWGEGIGERLAPLAFVARRYLVVYPGVHTATAAMFSHPDLPRGTPRITAAAYLEGAPVGNDFEALACALHADIARARQYLSTHIGRPRLTGSGSALFVELEPGQTPDLAGAPLNWHSRICNSLQNPFDSVDMATSESRAP